MYPGQVRPAAYNIPLPPDDYQREYNASMQKFVLNDPETKREIVRTENAIARENHKSALRQNEYANRQRMKQKEEKVVINEGCIMKLTINGLGVQVSADKLFSCQIEKMRRYIRGSDWHQWQMVLTEYPSGRRIISSLYNEEDLRKISRLRQTILARYDCTGASKNSVQAWKWMQNQLISLYDQTREIEIPSGAGWFEMGGRWHFWSLEDKDTMLLSRYMEEFRVGTFPDLNVTEVAEAVLKDTGDQENRTWAGILLLYRLASLLGRLASGDSPFRLGITLVGQRAEKVARTFLRTMYNEVDFASLDSDHIKDIQEIVESLQDTPVIFIVSDPADRTTQNRMRTVLKWMKSGYINGTAIKIPFIFCVERMSRYLPLEDMAVIDTGRVSIPIKSRAFAQLQSWISSMIEDSGCYWVNELRKKYEDLQKTQENENGSSCLLDTVASIVLKMLDEDRIGITAYGAMETLLRGGLEEIRRQSSVEYGVLSEQFHETVRRLAENGDLLFAERSRIPSEPGHEMVYFDDDCYYFVKSILEFICNRAEIDYKSMLFIKQQLAGQDAAKIYKTSSGHSRELDVDFLTWNPFGQRKSMSGFAIRRGFWDKPGGIALWERGKYYDADIM